MMNNTQFDTMRDDLHANAQKARDMAVSLEGVRETGAVVWHALADRLFDALAQADHMGNVVTPTNP